MRASGTLLYLVFPINKFNKSTSSCAPLMSSKSVTSGHSHNKITEIIDIFSGGAGDCK